ncbi:helix-turn-helix transcriptional regulator [Ferrimonas marina]|uniref:Transcriptional regulator, AlpA family n=1 Tax=Ferrimonas marina TaxID=299255 RepID=A0A1M5TST5_9GAMM|nr:hypothetical protein [Ferrimonas marina]SHH53636.1 transcriptional regulator, AlpA family [Ferrimonas marina]
MQKYNFELATNLAITDEEEQVAMSERLYEAGFGDSLVGFHYSYLNVDCTKTAEKPGTAIENAITQLQETTGALVVGVTPSPLASLSEVADFFKVSRMTIQRYQSGERGPGNFPAAAFSSGRRSSQWYLVDVAAWMVKHKLGPEHKLDEAMALEQINKTLRNQQMATNQYSEPTASSDE